MLSWSLIFLVIAIMAALFGFGVVTGVVSWLAKTLFAVFLVLFVISFVVGWKTPRAPTSLS